MNHQSIIKGISSAVKIKKNILVKKNDVLFVIDMQNDFLDRPYVDKTTKTKKTIKKFKKGKLPTFGSRAIVKPIARLTAKFAKMAKVVATRDYHPVKNPHCSFSIFGEHCAWKTAGSDIASEIEEVLFTPKTRLWPKLRQNCFITFKGFSSKIDSFGAFPYSKKLGLKRICGCSNKSCPTGLTGSFALKKYTKYPSFDKKTAKIPLQKLIKSTSKTKNTLFICGVLGDFCVLDTAKNARQAGYKNVVIIIDLIRSLRIKAKGSKGAKGKYPTTSKIWTSLAKKHGFKFCLSKNLKY